MRLLLDTQILLTVFRAETDRLPAGPRHLLFEPAARFYVSVATLWEIAIKSRLRKLTLPFDLRELPVLIRDLGFEIINVNEHHVLVDILPEPPTRDPFDRLLLAQCQVEGLALVTIDRALVTHPMAEKFSK